MKISKNIEHGDLQGLGLAKIRMLRDHGIYTYDDFSKLSVKEASRLPFFGVEGIASMNDFIATLEANDMKRKITNNAASSLTKREHFAGLAMQGFLASNDDPASFELLAVFSVSAADALLKALASK